MEILLSSFLLYLFQQFICYHGQQIAHCERRTVCGKADSDWSIIQNSPIQFGFSDLCYSSGFLKG